MKKLSLYIFLVLLWCNVGFAEEKNTLDLCNLEGVNVECVDDNDLSNKVPSDDLSGKQLLCRYGLHDPHALIFKSKSKVQIVAYNDEGWHEFTLKYKAKLKRIDVFGKYKGKKIEGSIHRKTLKSDLTSSINGIGAHQCEIIPKNINLKKKLKKEFNDKKAGNKI